MPSDSFQPSDKQIWDHVDQGIKALEKGTSHVRVIAEKHNQDALKFLDVDSMNEVMDWVLVFLKEIKDLGPKNCFVPHGWVNRCYEPGFSDIFLFPFILNSSHFQKSIYLKFGIRKNKTSSEPNIYCHLDLHQAN